MPLGGKGGEGTANEGKEGSDVGKRESVEEGGEELEHIFQFIVEFGVFEDVAGDGVAMVGVVQEGVLLVGEQFVEKLSSKATSEWEKFV